MLLWLVKPHCSHFGRKIYLIFMKSFMRIAYGMFSVIFLKLQSEPNNIYIANDSIPLLKRLLQISSKFTRCLAHLLY